MPAHSVENAPASDRAGSSWDRVSIVIVSFNTLALLQRCLSHLATLGVPAARIIVVDNASTDGSAQWLQDFQAQGAQVLLLNRNVGFAKGNNAGICYADADYVLLLNTDAFPEAGGIETLVAELDARQDAAIAGPQLLFENGSWQRSAGRLPSPQTARMEATSIPALARFFRTILWPLVGRWWSTCTVGYVDGACMMIRRNMLLRVGLFDEGYFFFAEDVDLCDRVQRFGYSVLLAPQSRVTHLRGGSSARKDGLATERMKRAALRRYLLRAHGEDGWRTFADWTSRNFRRRAAVCRFVSMLGVASAGRCEMYSQFAQLYGQPDLEEMA